MLILQHKCHLKKKSPISGECNPSSSERLLGKWRVEAWTPPIQKHPGGSRRTALQSTNSASSINTAVLEFAIAGLGWRLWSPSNIIMHYSTPTLGTFAGHTIFYLKLGKNVFAIFSSLQLFAVNKQHGEKVSEQGNSPPIESLIG